MKATVFFVAALLCSPSSVGQAKAEADPYKPVLDRLESLTGLAQPEWRYHADIPHPEARELSDGEWPTVKTAIHPTAAR
jgi:hypothetical protein